MTVRETEGRLVHDEKMREEPCLERPLHTVLRIRYIQIRFKAMIATRTCCSGQNAMDKHGIIA
jgi:hypothetical protein